MRQLILPSSLKQALIYTSFVIDHYVTKWGIVRVQSAYREAALELPVKGWRRSLERAINARKHSSKFSFERFTDPHHQSVEHLPLDWR